MTSRMNDNTLKSLSKQNGPPIAELIRRAIDAYIIIRRKTKK